MSPNCAYQLYTLHGYYKGEGMPLGWALLPNKSIATYTEMFGELRGAVIERFGNLGLICYAVTDFEWAVMESVRNIIPEVVGKGCTFHFRQAIMRHVADEGLRTAYNNNDTHEVKAWFRKIMGMSMLPTFFIGQACESIRIPPAQPSIITTLLLQIAGIGKSNQKVYQSTVNLIIKVINSRGRQFIISV